MGGKPEVKGPSFTGLGPGERHYQRLMITNNNQHQLIRDLNTPWAKSLANYGDSLFHGHVCQNHNFYICPLVALSF